MANKVSYSRELFTQTNACNYIYTHASHRGLNIYKYDL